MHGDSPVASAAPPTSPAPLPCVSSLLTFADLALWKPPGLQGEGGPAAEGSEGSAHAEKEGLGEGFLEEETGAKG